MNSDFIVVEKSGLSFVAYRPWWDEGIVHGSTLRPFSCDQVSLSRWAPALCAATGTTLIANLRQTHGSTYLDTRSSGTLDVVLRTRGDLERYEEGDALIAPLSQNVVGQSVAYGVSTADCVPLIVRGEFEWAVIHAGWRGLANGIIGKVLSALDSPVEVAIFPCAGSDAYEVGWEVIEAIGPSAAYTGLSAGMDKALLDTAGTAVNQLRGYLEIDRIAVSGICTIQDERFHSYRRDGEGAGRSLTFMVPGF
jgi:copper oxidase (laccase) domain-containing protein